MYAYKGYNKKFLIECETWQFIGVCRSFNEMVLRLLIKLIPLHDTQVFSCVFGEKKGLVYTEKR